MGNNENFVIDINQAIVDEGAMDNSDITVRIFDRRIPRAWALWSLAANAVCGIVLPALILGAPFKHVAVFLISFLPQYYFITLISFPMIFVSGSIHDIDIWFCSGFFLLNTFIFAAIFALCRPKPSLKLVLAAHAMLLAFT